MSTKQKDYRELLEHLKVLDAMDSMRVELNHHDLRIFIYLLSKKIEEASADPVIKEREAASALYHSLNEVVELLREEAPGTKLNNRQYVGVGIAANAALRKYEALRIG